MANDWIEGSDDGFNDQFDTFNTWAQANGLTRGLTAGQLTALAAAFAAWGPAFADHKTAATAAIVASVTKSQKRADGEALMRALGATIQTNAATTDADRTDAGLTVRSGTRTRAAVPTTRPVLMVDNSQRLQQTVNFRDETTPDSKKKPDGVMGCEFRYFCGDTPPADPEDFEYAGTDTGTPYLLVHDAADAGKKCWIVGRWVNTRGETGPWSESVMSTISA